MDQEQTDASQACGQSRSNMWQPIETAPKDGTVIDLWNASFECRVENASWFGEMWIAAESPSPDVEDVTHWMPLPPPPNADVSSGGQD